MTLPDDQYTDEQIDTASYAAKEISANVLTLADLMATGDRQLLSQVRHDLMIAQRNISSILGWIDLVNTRAA
jgi:hypothetical protein